MLHENLGSRHYRWLRPDLFPPAPYLVCDPNQTPGGSGVLVQPALIDAQFRKAWMPLFRREGRDPVTADAFLGKISKGEEKLTLILFRIWEKLCARNATWDPALRNDDMHVIHMVHQEARWRQRLKQYKTCRFSHKCRVLLTATKQHLKRFCCVLEKRGILGLAVPPPIIFSLSVSPRGAGFSNGDCALESTASFPAVVEHGLIPQISEGQCWMYFRLGPCLPRLHSWWACWGWNC